MNKVIKVIRWASVERGAYMYKLLGVEPTITMVGTWYNYEPKMDFRNIQALLNHAKIDWDKDMCFTLMKQMEKR